MIKLTTFGALKPGDVIVGPGHNRNARQVVLHTVPHNKLCTELVLGYIGASTLRFHSDDRVRTVVHINARRALLVVPPAVKALQEARDWIDQAIDDGRADILQRIDEALK